MKKSIIFSLIAMTFVAFTITGCDPQDKPGEVTNTITNLTVKPAQLVLTPGESTRLAAMTEPAGANVAIKWTSSNPDVASVSNNGTVTAEAIGQAKITAKAGDFTATCEVTVKSVYETLNFTGAFVLNWDTTYSDKLDTLSAPGWGPYVCKQALCHVELFTEGFYVNDELDLAGADKGAILSFDAPFDWAPAWCNGGQPAYFILGKWYILSEYADSAYSNVGYEASINQPAFAGAISDYMTAAYIDKDQTRARQAIELAATQISGATLTTYEYHTKEEGYSDDGYYGSAIPELFFGKGWVDINNNYSASGYMCSIESYKLTADELLFDEDTTTNEFHTYGVHFRETETSFELVDSLVTFGQNYKYELAAAAASAPAHKVAPKRQSFQVHMLTPEQKARHQAALNRKAEIKKK